MKAWIGVVLAIGCTHQAVPTITGAELYAQVPQLQATGRAQVASIEVHREQYLVSRATQQVFAIADVLQHCTGAGLEADPECGLALIRDLRFEVVDQAPTAVDPGHDHGMSKRHAAELILAAVAAPLTYGAFACQFDGCWAVFGTPLVLDLAALLIVAVGLH